MHITLENIKKVIDGLREDLGDGFVDTDIWNVSSNKSVAFHHQPGLIPRYGVVPKHIKTFSEISGILNRALLESDYHALGDYYLINLKNNRVVVVLNIKTSHAEAGLLTEGSGINTSHGLGGHQQFIMVDLSKTTMGVLMSIAIPRVLENLKYV